MSTVWVRVQNVAAVSTRYASRTVVSGSGFRAFQTCANDTACGISSIHVAYPASRHDLVSAFHVPKPFPRPFRIGVFQFALFQRVVQFSQSFHASCTAPFCAMLVILCVYVFVCGCLRAAWCIASGCFATTTRAI